MPEHNQQEISRIGAQANDLQWQVERLRSRIISGSGAPTSTPAFVGQQYIDTTSGNIYMAVGTDGAWNWGFIGAGGVVSFDKNTIPGLVSWHDASDASTVTLSGTSVTGWADKSGNGYNMVVDTAAPQYVTAYQNGLNVIQCNGSNQALAYNIPDLTQPYTRVMVFKGNNWGTGTYQVACGASTGGLIAKTTGSTNMYIYAGATLTYGALANNATYCVSAVYTGASSSVRVNNGTAVVGNAGTNSLTFDNVGVNYGIGDWFSGFFMESLVYSGNLSAAQLTTIYTYLNNKWAVA